MAIAGPTGSDSNAEGAVMGTTSKKKKDSYKPSCAGCGENDTWRRMLETWSGVERHLYKGDPDDEYEVRHWCIKCVAQDKGISEEAALSYILQNRPGFQRRKWMNSEYNHAMANVMQDFEGCSRSQLCSITREQVMMVLSPLAKFIARKESVMRRRSDLMGEHAKLAEMLFSTNDRYKAELLVDEMERIYDEIDATEKPIAFSDRVDKELPMADERSKARRQWEYMLAAQYGDLWCEVLDSKNRRVAAFMTYYVCLAGHSWEPCGTVMGSKVWDRLHEDPLKPKQRWYCNCCHAGFKTKFGVVIEILLPPTKSAPNGSWLYMRATVPDKDEEDIKAMRIEEELDPDSPEDLYNRLPNTTPSLDGGMFRRAQMHEMNPERMAYMDSTFKIIDVHFFVTLPKFPWKQVYTFADGEGLMKLSK